MCVFLWGKEGNVPSDELKHVEINLCASTCTCMHGSDFDDADEWW